MGFKKEIVEAAFYDLLDKQAFYGGLLQEIDVQFVEYIPSAALKYDKQKFKFSILINYDWFKQWTRPQRLGILFHEVLHFTHKHITRAMAINVTKPEEFKLANIAQDIAINQFISDLPPNCVKVEMFKKIDGTPFPLKETFEVYYKLLKEGREQEQNGGKDPNKEILDKFMQGEVTLVDTHLDEELTEEEQKAMLEEIGKTIERTVEKTQYGKDRIPAHVKDLLQEIETQIRGINYKKILREVIKRKASSSNRTNTWNRPSKRYGNLSPGTANDKLPELNIFVDTSGSISHTEINEFLQVIDGFLAAGSRKCKIGLWHTSLYHVQKYKKGEDFNKMPIESGGTEVTEVLKYIQKNQPNLAIILTDGCYYSQLNSKIYSDVIWVISKTGSKEHSLSKVIGKTIQMS